jgi:tRNA-2-methylthio-N6-dimethylallyladenosine synthase
VIVGTQSVKMLPMLVAQSEHQATRAIDTSAYDDVSFPLGMARRADPTKAYVTIIEGCNDFCAFCVVPYTRGPERMRPAADILSEVRQAVDAGHREVQLLGQIVNHYQAPDRPVCDFADLLALVDSVPGIERIRFASPHPRHVTPRLAEAIRDLPHVCKHIHLPVQSGSTRVLAAMRRRHSREGYLETIDLLRGAVPGLAISTDVIVGFPGERPEDFAETLSLAESVRYCSMFSFKYSPRPNTLAIRRMTDDVPEDEKTERIVLLNAVQRGIQEEIHAGQVGAVVEVLVDGRSRRREWELTGRTSSNTIVNFPGDPSLVGTTLAVRILRGGPHSVWGEIAAAETPHAVA